MHSARDHREQHLPFHQQQLSAVITATARQEASPFRQNLVCDGEALVLEPVAEVDKVRVLGPPAIGRGAQRRVVGKRVDHRKYLCVRAHVCRNEIRGILAAVTLSNGNQLYLGQVEALAALHKRLIRRRACHPIKVKE